MKKTFLAAMIAVLALTGCKNKEQQQQLEQAQAMEQATRQELTDAVADRDQLLSLVNEISANMEQIKNLENILSVNTGSETPGQRDQIRADLSAIQSALQERRQRLDELEQRLNSSNLNNNNLRTTVAGLRRQLDEQATEITTLRTNLDQAREQISNLDATVDSLHTAMTDINAQRDSTDRANTQLTDELNTCYYAIGTKDELRANHIIETGFLRRTKLMEGNFDQNFFTRADKRTLPSIDLNSNKAQVLTNMPADSYTIVEANGHKVLQITQPAKFWSLSNYLVIQID